MTGIHYSIKEILQSCCLCPSVFSFLRLNKLLFSRTHLQDLKEVTAQVHYEFYRHNRLEKVKGVPLNAVSSAPASPAPVVNDKQENGEKPVERRVPPLKAQAAKNSPKKATVNDVINNNAQPIAVESKN